MRYEEGVLAATKGRLKRKEADREERSRGKRVMTESSDAASPFTVSAALFAGAWKSLGARFSAWQKYSHTLSVE